MVKEKVENETKEERFKRIATKRANEVLNQLRLLGNCSNKGVYKYTDIQVSHIFRTIEDELKRIKILFKNNKREVRL